MANEDKEKKLHPKMTIVSFKPQFLN